MDEKRKECELALDLLPLYLDGKTGEESDAFLAQHLKECENCRAVQELLRRELPLQVRKKEPKRKRLRISKGWLFVILGLAVYLAVLAGIVWTILYSMVSSIM